MSEKADDNLAALEDRIASHPDDAETCRALADAYADCERWEEAVQMYQAAIVMLPQDADLYNNLGIAYEEIGSLDQAEQAYRHAISLQPDDTTAHYNLGMLYKEQQRIPEAVHVFEACLERSTDSEECAEIRNELSILVPERKDVVKMYKTIRGYTLMSLIVGALSVFSGGTLDPVWGVMMLGVGILTWRIRIPAVLVLYGVLMAWAALINGLAALTGAAPGWWALGAIAQTFWGVSLFSRFRKYHRLPLQALLEAGTWPAGIRPPQEATAITKHFAIVGTIMGIAALILAPALFVGDVVRIAVTGQLQTSSILTWSLSGVIDVAVSALGLSCAALLSRTVKRGWVIGGIATSAPVLVGGVLLMLLAKSGQTEVYLTQGYGALERGDFQSAVELFDQALDLDPQSAMACSGRGWAYYGLGEYSEAITSYNQAIALDPNLAMAYNNRGLAYAAQGQWEQAMADYDQAIALDPNLAIAYSNRGFAHVEQGQWEQAVTDYNQVLTLDPENLPYAYVNRSIAHTQLWHTDRATADLHKFLELMPDAPERDAVERMIERLGGQ
jgi:tetratricopeptide (TPR) repeat protein